MVKGKKRAEKFKICKYFEKTPEDEFRKTKPSWNWELASEIGVQLDEPEMSWDFEVYEFERLIAAWNPLNHQAFEGSKSSGGPPLKLEGLEMYNPSWKYFIYICWRKKRNKCFKGFL